MYPQDLETLIPIGDNIYSQKNVNVSLLLEFLRIPLQEFLGGIGLYQQFLEKIEETEFIEDERDIMDFYSVPLFALTLVRENIIAADLRAIISNSVSPQGFSRILAFLHLYEGEFKDAVKDPKIKPKILPEIRVFWTTIVNLWTSRSLKGFEQYQKLLGAIPPYIPAHKKSQLGLLAFWDEPPEMVWELQNKLKLGLLVQFKRRPIPTRVFYELMVDLPSSPPWVRSLLDFKGFVWEMHIRTHPKLVNLKISFVHMEFTSKQILEQLMCFLLPNWAQVWTEMGWPFTNEIQRRLRFLKTEGWRPEIKEFISLIVI